MVLPQGPWRPRVSPPGLYPSSRKRLPIGWRTWRVSQGWGQGGVLLSKAAAWAKEREPVLGRRQLCWVPFLTVRPGEAGAEICIQAACPDVAWVALIPKLASGCFSAPVTPAVL